MIETLFQAILASENGQSSIKYWEERLPQERAHEGHPMHGVSLDG